MKRSYVGLLGRVTIAFLCLVSISLAFWSGLFTLANWDNLWSGGDYMGSYSIYGPMQEYNYISEQMRDLYLDASGPGKLTYAQEQRLEILSRQLSPEKTNYRVEIRKEDGTLLYTNLPQGETMDQASKVEFWESGGSRGDALMAQDYQIYDDATGRYIMMVYLASGQFVECVPTDVPGQFNEYGYKMDDEGWVEYDSSMDSRVYSIIYSIQSGVIWPLQVNDAFWQDYQDYQQTQQYLPAVAGAAALLTALSLVLLVLFCRSAGRRRDWDGIAVSWQDRIPLDLYLCIFPVAIMALLSAGDSITFNLNQGRGNLTLFVGLGIVTALIVGLCLACLHTVVVRCKLHTLLRNTLVWRMCAWVGRFFAGVAANWSVTNRVVLTFILYLVITVITTLTVVMIPVWQGVVLWLLCRWVRQWRSIREGTEHIVGGEPNYKIPIEKKMYRDLREHAEQLNDMGNAIGSAVNERLKSERFKTELITNVSHDLKTPLTSIINYVDLLKKTEVEDERVQEYIEVLDRKSQRLKKLTEDLVEASKASTGVLSVSKERLGFLQLLDQALGEYREKFERSGLSPVFTAPDHELYVQADGRHLWRIVDNLLGNCVKYAMPGTRVYLDVKVWEGSVILSVKNISQEPLNVPAEQLMERFVRGEDSRSSEGSGLGLSIARSLTELQGGTFRLDIDGDLFKAVISFPECKELVIPIQDQKV